MTSKDLTASLVLALAFASGSITAVNAYEYCRGKVVLSSTPMKMPSGHTITMERFTCAEVNQRQIQTREAGGIVIPAPRTQSKTSSLLNRSASQCTTANWMCGVPCSVVSCRPASATIRPADCPNLIASLVGASGTIDIFANEGVGFVLGSCEYIAFGDSTTTDTQYCFGDMGVAAAIVFNQCGSDQQGSCQLNPSSGGMGFVDQISL